MIRKTITPLSPMATVAILAATIAPASLFPASLGAQQFAEGYAESNVALPAGTNNVLTTSFGTVYFDGMNLVLHAPPAQPQTLLTYASQTFGSFTAPIGTTRVLFGESSNGGIWNVPLNGQSVQQIATVPFNYDAVLLDDDRALVSAKTGGFSAPDNDVMFVDLVTGQTQLLAQFPGASGPLAVDANGDVYYATPPTGFPAPPATVTILRIPRTVIDSAILNNTVLGAADTQLVISGLDAAGDLAFDDDGDLFFVDWFSNHIGEINDADSAQPSLAPTLIDYAGTGLNGSVLQFVPGPIGAQVFEPFQPEGGQLLVHETDYVSISMLRTVTASRPEMNSSAPSPIPAGSFQLTTVNGPANGIGLLLFDAATAAGPQAISVEGFEQPLFLDSAIAATAVMIPVTFDANGQSMLVVNNPGFAPAFDAIAQTVCFTAAAGLGSTAIMSLQIGQ